MPETNIFHVRLSVITLAIVLITAACSSDSNPPPAEGVIAPAARGSEQYELGQSVYTTHCAACHGPNGEGQFPDAPLEPDETGRYGAPPHDETGHTWHHDDDIILQIIREGGMGDPKDFYVMPPLQTVLSDAQITAVIAYIKTLWTSEQVAMQQARTLAVRSQ